MRFANILLALPFVASAFAAPVAVQKKDVDVVAVVNAAIGVVANVGSLAGVTDVSAVVSVCTEVKVALGNACDGLGVQVGVGLDVGASVSALKKRADNGTQDEVAQLLTTLITDVNSLVGGIVEDVASDPTVSALLKDIDSALSTVLFGVEIILAGVLQLVKNLLGDLGLSGLLAGVTGLLGSLVNGVLSTLDLGGLLSGLGL